MKLNKLITNLLFISSLLTSLALPDVSIADEGEYYDIALADTINRTKKIHRSHVYAKVGAIALTGIDTRIDVTPAKYGLALEAGYYGIELNRHTKILRLSGLGNIGFHPENRYKFDAGMAKLSIYNYLNNGLISFGIFSASRNKATNEKISAVAKVMEYNAGGQLGALIFTLSTEILGYEFKRRFNLNDYHGMFLAGLRLEMGVILARDKNVSVEIKSFGEINLSIPKQRDIETAVSLALHFNNRHFPIVWSTDAGYNYYNEETDSNTFSYDHFFLTSMVGVRY